MSISYRNILAYCIPFLLLLLSNCAAPAMTGAAVSAGAAAGIYATKPGDLPPADTAHQIPPHENWCYTTMGDSQCYSHPQNTAPDRLINVDPQNRYPLTPRDYHEVVVEDQ